jgi:hypothetical protein
VPSGKSVRVVRPLQCADPRCAVAFGDRSENSDRRFRKAPPLPQVRKSERACNPYTSEAIAENFVMWQDQYFTATKRNAGQSAYSLDKKPGMESSELKRAAEAAPSGRSTAKLVGRSGRHRSNPAHLHVLPLMRRPFFAAEAR